jgi:hypothetical protein
MSRKWEIDETMGLELSCALKRTHMLQRHQYWQVIPSYKGNVPRCHCILKSLHHIEALNSYVEKPIRNTMSAFPTKVLANVIGFGIVWTGVLMFQVRSRLVNIKYRPNPETATSDSGKTRPSSRGRSKVQTTV